MRKASPLSRELGSLAFIVMEILKQEFKNLAGRGTPTLTQFKMLYAIQGGATRVGKLAETFCITQPATSKMVEAMVKEGMLKRIQHASDRRQIELRLTKKARAAIEAMHNHAFARMDERLDSIPATHKKVLARQLHGLVGLLTGERA